MLQNILGKANKEANLSLALHSSNCWQLAKQKNLTIFSFQQKKGLVITKNFSLIKKGKTFEVTYAFLLSKWKNTYYCKIKL